MGERSGLGLIECTILKALDALDALGARPGRRHRSNATVLAVLEDRLGLAPGYGYEVLLDLGRSWTMPVSLIHPFGNFGSRGDDPAANFRCTDSRLSPAGTVALAAERGELAPVPLGLINGSTYRGGTRPPFRPEDIIEALRLSIRRPRVTGAELAAIVGPPAYGNGCIVSGDFAALAAGAPGGPAAGGPGHDRRPGPGRHREPPAQRQSRPHRAAHRRPGPPPDWAERYPGLHQHTRLPLQDIRDESSAARGTDRIVCVPRHGTSPADLRDLLLDVDGVFTTVEVALPRPLAATIRSWVRAHQGEDLLASLAALEEAVNGRHP